jgi:adhesin transport system membrane fusion protein
MQVLTYDTGVPVARGARWAVRTAVLGVAALVVWAAMFKINQVTRAPAQIIPSDRTQVVQAPEAGVFTRLHVKEGDVVAVGQVLVTLEKERAQAAVSDSDAKVAALKITLTRLRSEVYGEPLTFSPELLAYDDYVRNQSALYRKRKTAIDEDIAAVQSMLSLAQQELTMNQVLEASGDVGKTEILRLQRSVAELRAQITNKRNKYFQDAQAEMT